MPGSEAFGLMAVDGVRPRVAVVGENVPLGMVTVMLIEQFGAAPVQVSTTEAAHRLLDSGRTVDLAVIDLAPRSLDAIAMAQLIGALGVRYGVPIIGLAGEHPDTLMLGRVCRFATVLRNPYSPRELFEAMRNVLPREGARALS